jgi:GPH family glycoside/pentoside/hexuronide:cation symporter
LPATLFLFFVADILQLEKASGPLLALYFVAGAASLPLWVKLARAVSAASTPGSAPWSLSIFAFAGASLLGSGDLWPFAAICIASGLALGADLALPAAIAADLGERQGQAGACFGVWNFVAKLNLALAAGLALPLLGCSATCRAAARGWRTDFCLCPAAARLQGAGRLAALALAPFSGDLT